jgi:hypothetical protein
MIEYSISEYCQGVFRFFPQFTHKQPQASKTLTVRMSCGITWQGNLYLMQLQINMLAEFGDFLADGHVGNRVMSLRVESVWDKCETIVFDFTGVHNITDSFVHATFGNMVEDHGDDFMKKTRF